MLEKFASVAAAAALLGAVAVPSQAMPLAQPADDSGMSSLVIHIANGCGNHGYRGPNGACHSYGTGPYPNGYYGTYHNAWRWNGCPRGYWRGPWGHCRNTPYHGRLPNGGWK